MRLITIIHFLDTGILFIRVFTLKEFTWIKLYSAIHVVYNIYVI